MISSRNSWPAKRRCGGRPHARIGQEIVDDGVDPGAFLEHQVQQLLLVALQFQFAGQDLHAAADAGQGIADLVGDAGGQFADGRQAVGLADPRASFPFPGSGR